MSFKEFSLNAKDSFGFEAIGEITADDYKKTLWPLFDTARKKGKKVRLLLNFGKEFKGYSAGAIWEDAVLGLKHLRTMERCALVSDHPWLNTLAKTIGSLVPCAVNTYKTEDFQEAKKWLDSGEIGLDHKLDTQKGVLNVEISSPLTSINLEILTDVADRYIEDHGALNGLVLHAKQFPGWENLGSMLSHITFVKDHHQKIKKIALVVDSSLADMAEKLASQFVKAQIKHFSYDQLEDANIWVRS